MNINRLKVVMTQEDQKDQVQTKSYSKIQEWFLKIVKRRPDLYLFFPLLLLSSSRLNPPNIYIFFFESS